MFVVVAAFALITHVRVLAQLTLLLLPFLDVTSYQSTKSPLPEMRKEGYVKWFRNDKWRTENYYLVVEDSQINVFDNRTLAQETSTSRLFKLRPRSRKRYLGDFVSMTSKTDFRVDFASEQFIIFRVEDERRCRDWVDVIQRNIGMGEPQSSLASIGELSSISTTLESDGKVIGLASAESLTQTKELHNVADDVVRSCGTAKNEHDPHSTHRTPENEPHKKHVDISAKQIARKEMSREECIETFGWSETSAQTFLELQKSISEQNETQEDSDYFDSDSEEFSFEEEEKLSDKGSMNGKSSEQRETSGKHHDNSSEELGSTLEIDQFLPPNETQGEDGRGDFEEKRNVVEIDLSGGLLTAKKASNISVESNSETGLLESDGEWIDEQRYCESCDVCVVM